MPSISRKIKIIVTLFFLCVGFFSFFNKVDALSCCLFDNVKSARPSSNFNDAAIVNCTEIDNENTEKKCKEKEFKRSNSDRTAMLVPNCKDYCAKKDDLLMQTINKFNCCYSEKKDNVRICQNRGKEITTCPSGYTFQKISCSMIDGCPEFGKVLTDEEIQKQKDNIANDYKQSIQASTIPPKLQIALPGLSFENATLTEADAQGKQYISIPWIGQYIVWIYSYAIGIAGVLAVVLMMIGGFMWILSAGDAGKIGEAKQYITSAVTGLIVVMTAYLMLNFINPNLINPQALMVEIPYLPSDTNRNISIDQECDFGYLNQAIKPQLDASKTKHGKTYCPNYESLKPLFPTLDSKEFTVAGGGSQTGQRFSAEVLNMLKNNVEKDLEDKSIYNSKYLEITMQDQSLEALQEKCQASVKKRLLLNTANATIAIPKDPAFIPDCKSLLLQGAEIHVTLKDNKDANFNCNGSTNNNYDWVDHFDPKKLVAIAEAAEKYKLCRKMLNELMRNPNEKAGFTADLKRWWRFML